MALKKNTTFMTQSGFQVQVTNAYIKVFSLTGDKNSINAQAYWLRDDKSSDPFQITTCQFAPSMNGENFIAQAYAHLKTLPEFSGAEDC